MSMANLKEIGPVHTFLTKLNLFLQNLLKEVWLGGVPLISESNFADYNGIREGSVFSDFR